MFRHKTAKRRHPLWDFLKSERGKAKHFGFILKLTKSLKRHIMQRSSTSIPHIDVKINDIKSLVISSYKIYFK